jgi:hypothetical protein
LIATQVTREKLLTPGEATVTPETIVDGSIHAGLDVALGDLRSWHTLRALAQGLLASCQDEAEAIVRRYGKDALFSSVERALFCTGCCSGGPVRLEILSMPRCRSIMSVKP